jgi:hypothetical protein
LKVIREKDIDQNIEENKNCSGQAE